MSIDRLRDWARRGDLDAAAELFADARRRGAHADAAVALGLLVDGGRWSFEVGTADAGWRARLRLTGFHAAIGGSHTIAAATRHGGYHPDAVTAAELVVTTLREVVEPHWEHDCTQVWEPPDGLATRTADAGVVRAAIYDCPLEETPHTPTERMRAGMALARRRLDAWCVRARVARSLAFHLHVDAVALDGASVVVGHLGAGTVFEIVDGVVSPRTRRHDQLRSPMHPPVTSPERGRGVRYPNAMTGLLGADDSEPPDVFELPLTPDTVYVVAQLPSVPVRDILAVVRDAVAAGLRGDALCARTAQRLPQPERGPGPAVASIALVRHPRGGP